MSKIFPKIKSKSVFFPNNTLWQIITVVAFLSVRFLLYKNMGSRSVNEVDVLPLARQYFDSSWMPQDWYLNQPAGYRLLFQTLVGWLIVNFGFLAASIIGRLLCYLLVAMGLVLIAKQLRLSLSFLLLAIVLFTYTCEISYQGAIASEWIVGGLEAKAIAYGFVLIAISFFLTGQYIFMSLLLGCATSFHVLVGGWAFLICIGWFCIRSRQRLPQISKSIPLLLLSYITTSIFAISAVWQQLSIPNPINSNIPSPSFIYVFLRLSNHLNPFSWGSSQWIELIIYLLVLLGSMFLLNNKADKRRDSEKVNYSRQSLGELALISLIPFFLGVAIAFFDTQGQWLQYYPFRFGDVMLPLTTCLLFACTLEDVFFIQKSSLKSLICITILTLALSLQSIDFYQELLALKQFPSKQQGVSAEWKDMSNWIRQNTTKNAVIISSPVKLANFTWLTERSTIAKFKLFSQTKTQILEQYKRLDDLSGNHSLSAYLANGDLDKEKTEKILANGYNNLTTAQAETLMAKYDASYFLTNITHPLDFEIVYRKDPYILYVN